MSTEQELVRSAHAASSNQELLARYARWASGYEVDLVDGLGYTMPGDAARILARHTSASARILDAGAGTGLVGQALAALGFEDIVAMDMSPEMLEQARAKQVYADLLCMVLGEPLDLPDDSFDATISIGTFTVGHAPARALDELVRVTKPGGHVVFSLPTELVSDPEFDARLRGGRGWELVEASEPFRGLPKGDARLMYQYWTFVVSA